MPKQKDLKRIVRKRMQKTGESYTSARSRVLGKGGPRPAEYATIAGMSDDAVRAKSGMTWRQWVAELDAAHATELSHREIAKHVHGNYDVSGWWAQMITVAYERIRGLRDVGQRRGGKYDAHKSKTFAVPISRLYRAFSVKRTRGQWLPEAELKIRTSRVDKSMRISWPDGTSVHAYFTPKGPKKSQVAIQHVGLPKKADVAKRKDYWAARFAALGEVL
jgi:hypothetical protein